MALVYPRRENRKLPYFATFPFWVEPDSIFGSLAADDASENSHMLAIPSILAPVRLMLADLPLPHGFGSSLTTAGYVVSGLYTVCYLTAIPLRILLVEQQVQFALLR